jgi:hypothetical protein
MFLRFAPTFGVQKVMKLKGAALYMGMLILKHGAILLNGTLESAMVSKAISKLCTSGMSISHSATSTTLQEETKSIEGQRDALLSA